MATPRSREELRQRFTTTTPDSLNPQDIDDFVESINLVGALQNQGTLQIDLEPGYTTNNRVPFNRVGIEIADTYVRAEDQFGVLINNLTFDFFVEMRWSLIAQVTTAGQYDFAVHSAPVDADGNPIQPIVWTKLGFTELDNIDFEERIDRPVGDTKWFEMKSKTLYALLVRPPTNNPSMQIIAGSFVMRREGAF